MADQPYPGRWAPRIRRTRDESRAAALNVHAHLSGEAASVGRARKFVNGKFTNLRGGDLLKTDRLGADSTRA